MVKLKIIGLSKISYTHVFSHMWNPDLKKQGQKTTGTIWEEWRDQRERGEENKREGRWLWSKYITYMDENHNEAHYFVQLLYASKKEKLELFYIITLLFAS
jgi:hypothetical protein